MTKREAPSYIFDLSLILFPDTYTTGFSTTLSYLFVQSSSSSISCYILKNKSPKSLQIQTFKACMLSLICGN
jgi:hypothetical protein